MTKAIWKKTQISGTSCLVADCLDAETWLSKTKLGQGVLIDPRRPRNINHHRKLFALLTIAVENWPIEITKEALLGLIKLKTGHADPIKSADGMIYHIPKSINFESMGQDEFNPFYESALNLIALALGVDAETLDSERARQ